jgi:hypothetical protein
MINKFINKENGGSPSTRQKIIAKPSQVKTAQKANVLVLQSVYQSEAK